jgi:ubiquinone/menaquinone biosynthesis C-methylase UbiE
MNLTEEEAISIIFGCQDANSNYDRAEIAAAVDRLEQMTSDAYDHEASRYIELRGQDLTSDDVERMESLLSLVRRQIAEGQLQPNSLGKWHLLDVGAGYGRDAAILANEQDIEVSALDNCPAFVAQLQRRHERDDLQNVEILDADMRDMHMIESGSFHCVRNHAALLHLPIVPYGLGADSAISEARRVLLEGGVFYCLVKHGANVEIVDTWEGLGRRFYQNFTTDSIATLLNRHSFEIVYTERQTEHRPPTTEVDWLLVHAIAK